MECDTLPKTNKSPLKMGQNPKGKDRLPTIQFSGATLVSGKVNFFVRGSDGTSLVGPQQKAPHAATLQNGVM